MALKQEAATTKNNKNIDFVAKTNGSIAQQLRDRAVTFAKWVTYQYGTVTGQYGYSTVRLQYGTVTVRYGHKVSVYSWGVTISKHLPTQSRDLDLWLDHQASSRDRRWMAPNVLKLASFIWNFLQLFIYYLWEFWVCFSFDLFAISRIFVFFRLYHH